MGEPARNQSPGFHTGRQRVLAAASVSWDAGVTNVEGLSMSQMNDLKREIQEPKNRSLSWRAKLFIVLIGAPMVFLFAFYGGLELAMPLTITIYALGFVVYLKWKLRQYAWFWITMTVIAALHVPLILFVPWTTKWVPGWAVAGFATVDFVLILWILLVVEKFMGEPKAAER